MVKTAWTAGRLTGSGAATLVFGRMYEDPDVEVAALPTGRILAIASAGDRARAPTARPMSR